MVSKRPQIRQDAILHLLGGFVGKRNREDVTEVMGFIAQRPLQVLFGKGTGFAGAGGGAIKGEGFQKEWLCYSIYDFCQHTQSRGMNTAKWVVITYLLS